MIDKLTPDQKVQLDKFYHKCLKIGLCTDPIPRAKTIPEVNYIYKNFFNMNDPIIWYSDSPYSFNILINILRNMDIEKPEVEKIANALTEDWNKGDQKFYNSLEKDQLKPIILDETINSLEKHLGKKINRKEIVAKMEQNFKTENIYWGNIDIYWISFYLFPMKYLGVKYTDFQEKSLLQLYSMIKKIGFIFFFNDICFVIDRPLELHKKDSMLHNDGGPAIRYRDGYSIWYLNGIKVTKEIAETPADKLDPQLLVREKNIEIRREIAKKIGNDRLVASLGAKCIDKYKNYELVLLNVDISNTERRRRPFLKMINPSTGNVHYEGVPPEIKTVKEAIIYRNNLESFEEPIVLT